MSFCGCCRWTLLPLNSPYLSFSKRANKYISPIFWWMYSKSFHFLFIQVLYKQYIVALNSTQPNYSNVQYTVLWSPVYFFEYSWIQSMICFWGPDKDFQSDKNKYVTEITTCIKTKMDLFLLSQTGIWN